jgi:hypothetical protein
MSSNLCSSCIYDRLHVIKCGVSRGRALSEDGSVLSPTVCRDRRVREELRACRDCGRMFSTACLNNGYCSDCMISIYSV